MGQIGPALAAMGGVHARAAAPPPHGRVAAPPRAGAAATDDEIPPPPTTFWAVETHSKLNADGSINVTWTDHVAYDCAANQRARTLHETKTNMTITYLNWYDGDGRAGNIQPFFERYVCDIFAAGGGASCPTYAYPWFTRGMRATNEGPTPCAAGTCTAWTVDNGILTYLFDSSGTIVRAEKREGGALIETYDYADLKAEAPPEWLFRARTPTDNATCLDFSAASPPSPAAAAAAARDQAAFWRRR